MNVVVIGKGGREHALAWRLLQDGCQVVVTPGSPGIPGSVKTDPLELSADLFVIGPEQPAVDGLADRLRAQGKLVLGPGADGATLEGSKIWMKQLLNRAGVATAPWTPFLSDDEAEITAALRRLGSRWAIKTDYLAAGKGVLVTSRLDEAVADVQAKVKKGAVLGELGLDGREYSFFALCAGTSWSHFPAAQDYKKLLDGDLGPNTGGMGSYSPVAGLPGPEELDLLVGPTVNELHRRGIDYRGVLYGGVMLVELISYILEYNIRFGDPEAQVILPRVGGNLAEHLIQAAAGGPLTPIEERADLAAVTVVLAAEGYPEKPVPGDVIRGLDKAAQMEDVVVFHAGTDEQDGQFRTAGGRVLSVTGMGQTVAQARQRAYEAVEVIDFRGMQYRSDIAADA